MNITKFYECLSDAEKKELTLIMVSNMPKQNSLFTEIHQWVNKQKNISVRLRHVLVDAANLRLITFVEQVKEDDFMKLRNAGKVSWKEFVRLREY